MIRSILRNIVTAAAIFVGVGVVSVQSHAANPAFVDTLVPGYLEIQHGLATDDLPAAQTGAENFLTAIAAGPKMQTLTEAAETISSASEISDARAAFLAMSDQMIKLAEHIGIAKTPALFVMHCPMAFDGKGGDWLQADKDVSNPYLGSSMPTCGTVKEEIEGKE